MASCYEKFSYLIATKRTLVALHPEVNVDEFVSLERRILENNQQNNPVLVSLLGDIYMKILQKFLETKPKHILIALLATFEELYPAEALHIHQYIDTYSFTKGRLNGLLKGCVQSGKTAIIVLSMLCYLTCNRDVIVIVRDKLGEKTQFINRFHNIVNELQNHLFSHPNYMIATGNIPEHPCAFVELYHSKNLQKLYTRIRDRNLKNAVLYIDEADLRETYTAQIFNKVGKTIYVSATVQDILVADWKIRTDNIMKLTPPPAYKGVSNLLNVTYLVPKKSAVFYAILLLTMNTECITTPIPRLFF